MIDLEELKRLEAAAKASIERIPPELKDVITTMEADNYRTAWFAAFPELISRLEAAEALINGAIDIIVPIHSDLYEAWQKVKGEQCLKE